MKILVTGGAGFIGSHLSKRLLADNHEVSIMDCLHPYYPANRKIQHLETIKPFGDFQFFEEDLLNREGTIQLFKRIKPDVVVHLAALPGVAYSIEKPLEYVDFDIKATINMLEAAGVSGVKKVIFASSSSVYGDQKGPFREETANGKVVSPYAAAKYSAESFCHVYRNLYGFEVDILRFFTVYGPWGRPDMAIVSFMKKLMKNETITIFGEGSARDYTYIDDIVEGIYLSMLKMSESHTFNLGSGNPITMDDLLKELKFYFPNMEVVRTGTRVGDVHKTWANITKASSKLGYNPKITFQKGIAKTVEWAREYENFL